MQWVKSFQQLANKKKLITKLSNSIISVSQHLLLQPQLCCIVFIILIQNDMKEITGWGTSSRTSSNSSWDSQLCRQLNLTQFFQNRWDGQNLEWKPNNYTLITFVIAQRSRLLGLWRWLTIFHQVLELFSEWNLAKKKKSRCILLETQIRSDFAAVLLWF